MAPVKKKRTRQKLTDEVNQGKMTVNEARIISNKKPLIAERAPRSKPRPYPYDEKVNAIGTIVLVVILIACGGAAYWLL